MIDSKKITIAAMGDLHMNEKLTGEYAQLFKEISQKANILLLCGDLTDHGTKREAELLGKELSVCEIPIVAVLGNHDYEHDLQDEITQILTEFNVTILDGDTHELDNIGFAGVKGFGGGIC